MGLVRSVIALADGKGSWGHCGKAVAELNGRRPQGPLPRVSGDPELKSPR